jgi:SAM-dependent methyltransferase
MATKMYSPEWFSTFSSTIPSAVIQREVDALSRLFPLSAYAELLDVGCGIGRIAGPLASRGYRLTGIDIDVSALRQAQQLEPGPTYIAMDQRHVGLPSWRFDAAFLLWNSIGFVSRVEDGATLSGLHSVIRSGGLLALDMYHPGWLELNADQPSPQQGPQTVSTQRWVQNGRLYNHIEYGNGVVDRIDFEVYWPDDLVALAGPLGFQLTQAMVWWDPMISPSQEHARYQLLFRRA